MRKFPIAFSLSALSLITTGGVAALAQDTVGVTERGYEEVTRGVFDSPVRASLDLGTVAFQDANGDSTSRAAGGVRFDWNASGLSEMPSRANYGFSTGLIYSHLGAPGSDFFGTSAPVGADGGDANQYQIPLLLSAGYQISDRFLFGGHAGANLLILTRGDAMQLGRNVDPTGNATEFFPMAGLDLGWELSRVVGLQARGDYTFTPGDDYFTGTLGASFALG